MMNVGNPELAFSFANLPSEGIGLARMEFKSLLIVLPSSLKNVFNSVVQ